MQFKKGVVEIQFNWLFVLIIGAIILIFFSGIIVKQKNVAETSKNVLIVNNLDAVLSGSEVSAGTVNTIKIPDSKIEFECNRYSIDKLSKKLDVMNVFTPSILEGDKLIAMALDFSIPFRVTNLLYLTNPEYRYIFIGTNDLMKDIKNLMPNETFLDTYLPDDEIVYRGESKVRLIYFKKSGNPNSVPTFVPQDFKSVRDDDVTALEINLDNGEIVFFEKRFSVFQSIGASYYLGDETLLGAIYSDNPEIYTCVMDNVFNKMNIVTQIYMKKIDSLVTKYSDEEHRCKNYISIAYTQANFIDILKESSDFSSANRNKIINAMNNIKAQNNIAQLQSCATIY